jgi:tripartite-type tricarboxylate transporter receptor subunit TctC
MMRIRLADGAFKKGCDMNRMHLLLTGFLLTAFSLPITPSAQAQTQAWPNRPIKLLVPLAAGSTADIISRLVGTELAKALGQPIVVENKAGAGGTIATAEVARSPADGYTIAFASQGTLVFNQALYAKPGYDSVKDITPIAFAGGVANVMVVPPHSPWADPGAARDAAKAKPGALTFSSGGSGTSHHLSGVLFGQLTGTDLLHIPYKGAPQGIFAVMSEEVAMGFFNTPTVINQIREGKLKALGITSLKRSPLLPEVPTLDEKGIKGYEVNTWFGWIGPRALPPEITQRLHTEITSILARPDIKENLLRQGFDVAPPTTSAEFAKLINDDLGKWIPVVRRSGAKVD